MREQRRKANPKVYSTFEPPDIPTQIYEEYPSGRRVKGDWGVMLLGGLLIFAAVLAIGTLLVGLIPQWGHRDYGLLLLGMLLGIATQQLWSRIDW